MGAVRQQQPLRARGLGCRGGLVGREVPTLGPVEVGALDGRLADEEVGAFGQADQPGRVGGVAGNDGRPGRCVETIGSDRYCIIPLARSSVVRMSAFRWA